MNETLAILLNDIGILTNGFRVTDLGTSKERVRGMATFSACDDDGIAVKDLESNWNCGAMFAIGMILANCRVDPRGKTILVDFEKFLIQTRDDLIKTDMGLIMMAGIKFRSYGERISGPCIELIYFDSSWNMFISGYWYTSSLSLTEIETCLLAAKEEIVRVAKGRVDELRVALAPTNAPSEG